MAFLRFFGCIAIYNGKRSGSNPAEFYLLLISLGPTLLSCNPQPCSEGFRKDENGHCQADEAPVSSDDTASSPGNPDSPIVAPSHLFHHLGQR